MDKLSFQSSGTSTEQASAHLPHAIHFSSSTYLGDCSTMRLYVPALLSASTTFEQVITSIFSFQTTSLRIGLSRHIPHSSAIFTGENTLPILAICPPIEGLCSIRVTLVPCLAKESAAFIPAIPPPITATSSGVWQ